MKNSLLEISEDAMYELISSMPNPAHIKNIQNGKYINTNILNLKTYGFTKESEFIGLTLNEINGFMRPYWGKAFYEKILLSEEKMKVSGNTDVVKNLIFRDKNNFIRYQDVHKIPVFCKSNTRKIGMILTMTVEHTDKICLIDLYGKYKDIYENKADASRYFAKYLEIDRFLYEPLTEKEFLCLLYAIYNQSHKSIAESLCISSRTVDTHLTSISNKIKNFVMQDVISFLRRRM